MSDSRVSEVEEKEEKSGDLGGKRSDEEEEEEGFGLKESAGKLWKRRRESEGKWW